MKSVAYKNCGEQRAKVWTETLNGSRTLPSGSQFGVMRYINPEFEPNVTVNIRVQLKNGFREMIYQ